MKVMIGSIEILAGIIGVVMNAGAENNLNLTTSTATSTKSVLGKPVCIYNANDCVCENDLPNLPITSPTGMLLVDACVDETSKPSYINGNFTFKGVTTVNGVVRREDTSAFGDDVRFNAKNTGKFSQFSSYIFSLKFSDHPEIAIIKFKLPSLSEKERCWEADAAIKVITLNVIAGDTDEAGSYPQNYDVLMVGQYRRCEAQ